MNIRSDLLWELAYTVMRPRRFHDMLSISWRTRKTGGIIQWVQRLENRGANGIGPSPRSEAQELGTSDVSPHLNPKAWALMSLGRKKWSLDSSREQICPFSAFHSILALKRLDDVHSHWWGWSLFSLQIQNSNLFHKYPRKCTLRKCFTSYLGIP